MRVFVFSVHQGLEVVEAMDVLDIHIEWSTDGATRLDELTRPALLQRAEPHMAEQRR